MKVDVGAGRKVVIIPDVHDRYRRAEDLIAREDPDAVVFLGDYFDSHEHGRPRGTAAWLKRSMEEPGRIHLLGNHDMHYMSTNPELRCSGYDERVLKWIKDARVPWGRAAPYCWVDGWLCTHAGLSAAFVRGEAGRADLGAALSVLEGAHQQLRHIDDPSRRCGLFQAGVSRGGTQENGGITWCDYGEFGDVPGLRQIFGHTRGDGVRHGGSAGSEHYCIDTALGHYAVYSDGRMAVRRA